MLGTCWTSGNSSTQFKNPFLRSKKPDKGYLCATYPYMEVTLPTYPCRELDERDSYIFMIIFLECITSNYNSKMDLLQDYKLCDRNGILNNNAILLAMEREALRERRLTFAHLAYEYVLIRIIAIIFYLLQYMLT